MDYHLNWLPRLCRRSPLNGSFIWIPLTTYPDFLFMLFNTFYIGFQKDCVIHHGDHEQFRLTLFCPRLFSRCPQLPSCNTWTWNDPELFEQLPISPHEAQVCIQQAFPTCLVRTYPWGFRKKATLPYGFVFLKREKIGKKVGL